MSIIAANNSKLSLCSATPLSLIIALIVIISSMVLHSSSVRARMYPGQAISIPRACALPANDLRAVSGLAPGLVCWNGMGGLSPRIFIGGSTDGNSVNLFPSFPYAAISGTDPSMGPLGPLQMCLRAHRSDGRAASVCSGDIHYQIDIGKIAKGPGKVTVPDGGTYVNLMFPY